MKLLLFPLLVSGILGGPVLSILESTQELSTLNFYVNASTSLTKLLSSVNNFTFLAPSNSALEKWLSRGGSISSDVIEMTLRYHLLHGRFPTLSFTEEPQFVHSFLENKTYTNVTGGQVVEIFSKNGQAQAVSGNKSISIIASPPDLICAGGFVQIINSVLEIPLGLIQSFSQLKLRNFIAMLNAGNFVRAEDSPLIRQVLAAPNMTYFAPNTPEALAAFSAAAKNMTGQQISDFFGYHVVPGIFGYSSNLKDGMRLKTVQGSELLVTVQEGQIYVNSAKIITSDYLIANGVLHTIDSNLDRFNITTPPPPQTLKSTQDETGGSGLSGGAKAGIGISVILGVFSIAAIVFLLLRWYRRRKESSSPKEIDGRELTQELGYRGQQRPVHRPTNQELELDAISYGSLDSSQKKWEIDENAVELDGKALG